MRADRQEEELQFTRRALLLGGVGGAAFTVLGARLYALQVLDTERYQLLSEDNQFNYQLDPPFAAGEFENLFARDSSPEIRWSTSSQMILTRSMFAHS